MLLDQGAPLDLMPYAIQDNRPPLVMSMLARRADPNSALLQEGKSYSALRLAAQEGSTEIILLLLHYGARAREDPAIAKRVGSAAFAAAEKGHWQALAALVRGGATISQDNGLDLSAVVGEQGGGKERVAAYAAIEQKERRKNKKSRQHRYEMLHGLDPDYPYHERAEEWAARNPDPIDYVDPKEKVEELAIT